MGSSPMAPDHLRSEVRRLRGHSSTVRLTVPIGDPWGSVGALGLDWLQWFFCLKWFQWLQRLQWLQWLHGCRAFFMYPVSS